MSTYITTYHIPLPLPLPLPLPYPYPYPFSFPLLTKHTLKSELNVYMHILVYEGGNMLHYLN